MNPRSVYVKLRPAEVEALGRLAYAERRRPSDQAAVLLSEALERATKSRMSAAPAPQPGPEAGGAT